MDHPGVAHPNEKKRIRRGRGGENQAITERGRKMTVVGMGCFGVQPRGENCGSEAKRAVGPGLR